MNKRLFVIADIHGCFDSLKELVENKIQLQKNDKLILLGDYIDRGNKSKEVVDFVIELLENGYDVISLMGNHEAMLLDAFEDEKNISKWIQNGGNETLKSFEINSLKDIESKYIEFFKGLRYYYAFEDYLFVHAGFNDEEINPFEDPYTMVWKSRKKYNNLLLSNRTIIHGHRPLTVDKCRKRVDNNDQVLNIDTGCVYSDEVGYGKLTALEVNTRSIYFV